MTLKEYKELAHESKNRHLNMQSEMMMSLPGYKKILDKAIETYQKTGYPFVIWGTVPDSEKESDHEGDALINISIWGEPDKGKVFAKSSRTTVEVFFDAEKEGLDDGVLNALFGTALTDKVTDAISRENSKE